MGECFQDLRRALVEARQQAAVCGWRPKSGSGGGGLGGDGGRWGEMGALTRIFLPKPSSNETGEPEFSRFCPGSTPSCRSACVTEKGSPKCGSFCACANDPDVPLPCVASLDVGPSLSLDAMLLMRASQAKQRPKIIGHFSWCFHWLFGGYK